MKMDFTKSLINLDGTAMKERVASDDGKTELMEVTLGLIASNALLQGAADEKVDGNKKQDRWMLAARIRRAKSKVSLSIEELQTVKKLIGDTYPAAIVGPAYLMLEGKSFTLAEEDDDEEERRANA